MHKTIMKINKHHGIQSTITILLCIMLLFVVFPTNVNAYGIQYTYYETNSNSETNPDLISIGYGSGDEHHVFGTISDSSDSDWYKFQPLRHGRVFVMVLCDGIFYNVDVYKGNTNNEIYSNSYTTYSCIADISFMVTRNTVNNNSMPTYYINISSYNNSHSATEDYRIIVFYALYNTSDLQYPLTLTGSNSDVNLKITSSVGYRTYDYEYHIGTDIKSSFGDSLYSISDAYVYKSEDHATYGNRVYLILDIVDPYNTNNKINARYYHLSDRSVNTGANITKGEIIGEVGYDNLPDISHTHLHIDFNNLPSDRGESRFLQTYIASNPECIINLVDVFPNLSYWAGNSNYIYINS